MQRKRVLEIEYHPDAINDVLGAIAWYEERSPQVAANFRAQLAEAERQILLNPLRWATYLHGTRRYIFRRFPYALVYRVQNEQIIGIAVPHLHRKPKFWQTRLDDS